MSEGYYEISSLGSLATEAMTPDERWETQAMWAFERTAWATGLIFGAIELYRGDVDTSVVTNGEMPPLPPGPDHLLYARAYFRHPGSV